MCYPMVDTGDLGELMTVVEDLPDGQTALHRHPDWRAMAGIMAMIVLEKRQTGAWKNKEQGAAYPYDEIREALDEEWGVEYDQKSLKAFLKHTVERAIAGYMVPQEWHRKMALRAAGRLDSVGRAIEQAEAANMHAMELLQRRGEVVYEEDGKMRVTAAHADVTKALAEARKANREMHEMLVSIGWAPPLQPKGGTQVNVQANFGVEPATAFKGFGSGATMDAERVKEE